MKGQTGWPEDSGAPAMGMHYYRAGEVIVLIEPKVSPPDDASKERDQLHEALFSYFETIGHPLREGSFEREDGHSAKDRNVVPLRLSRRAAPAPGEQPPTLAYLLQTVTLGAAPSPETHDIDEIRPGIDAVIQAIRAINDPQTEREREAKAAIAGLGFPVVAATPNWLSMPLHN